MAFLDETGLAYFLGKLKAWIAGATSGLVHNTGNETVGGVKTFSSNVLSDAFRGTATDSKGMVTIEGGTATTGAMCLLYGCQHSTNPGQFALRARFSSGGVARLFYGEPSGSLYWNGQAIQTSSDERLKTPMQAVPDAVLDAWGAVQWGQFQFLDAVESKGSVKARQHLGMIAQRVKAAFEAAGLDACAYGILCLGEDGFWTVRYTEALAMEAAFQRRRAERLESRLDALEARLDG